jgi:NAD(P)-dependent dehydrogenase (short-subunit alcohol dehydrogenase family)
MASKFIGKYSLNGRLAIVTGASQGLGKTTAQTLSAMGADVVLAVRNVAATKSMIEREMVPWVKQQQPSAQPSIQAMSLDLASFESVRGFVQQLSQIYPKRSPSLLINNAGAMMKQRSVTVDENEYLLQVNYLSPVLLRYPHQPHSIGPIHISCTYFFNHCVVCWCCAILPCQQYRQLH